MDPFRLEGPPPRRPSSRPGLGKAEATRLTSSLDDDAALRSALAAALVRLTGAPVASSFAELVDAAGAAAGWGSHRRRLLVDAGEEGTRERVELARALAELRRLA